MSSKVCVVTGAGPANGAAFARKFVAQGYQVALLSRSADKLAALASSISGAHPYPTDVGEAGSVAETFAAIRSDLGPVDVLVHNAGNAVFGSFSDIDAETLEQAWKVNTLGLLLCGQEVVPDMVQRESGSIVVVGATAALRGGAAFAAFASAKAAQRILAESMARSLGPQGVHVAYMIVDGVIETPMTRQFFPDRPQEFFLQSEAIADTLYHLVTQDRCSWTFELDVRPFGENW